MRWEGDKGGRASLGPPWTEEKQATLRRMWGGKSSASDIARAFGDGTTRNAVIGKVHRLGLGRGSAEIVAAKRRGGQAAGAATKRAKSNEQRAKSARVIAERQYRAALTVERREKQAAIGRSVIAKVELALIDNPAFVKVEKPIDLHSHMRSDKSFHDAVAALTR